MVVAGREAVTSAGSSIDAVDSGFGSISGMAPPSMGAYDPIFSYANRARVQFW